MNIRALLAIALSLAACARPSNDAATESATEVAQTQTAAPLRLPS